MIAPDNAFEIITILVDTISFGNIGERQNWVFGLFGVYISNTITALVIALVMMPYDADS